VELIGKPLIRSHDIETGLYLWAMDEDLRVFESLESGLDRAMNIAKAARSQGKDPSTEVEIPLAVDLAERVEKLIVYRE